MRRFRASWCAKKTPTSDWTPSPLEDVVRCALAREAIQTRVHSLLTTIPLGARMAGGKPRMAGSVKTRKASETEPLSVTDGLKSTSPPLSSADF